MQNKDVIGVITQGRAYRSSSFLLKMATNKDNLVKNIAILCPKKQFSTAVQRNRAKRKMKNCIAKGGSYKKALNKGFLYVFTLHKSVLSQKHADLRVEFEQFVAKNAIL